MTEGQANLGAAQPLLELEGLTVEFPTPNGMLRAAGDISFAIAPGELVALVGESGSGKSVTAMAILGLVPSPGRIVGGRVHFAGTDLTQLAPRAMNALRAGKIGWVSQSPRASLNPSFRIRQQLGAVLAASEPDLPAKERDRRGRELIAPMGFADPARVLEAFPHELSGGMCQRVAIAMALAGDPALLIADEPTTALDVSVQVQILALLRRLNQERGLSILLVTHDLAIVSALARRTVVLYGGEVQETGLTADILSAPAHPYTRALLRAIPDQSRRRLPQLPGQAEPPLAGTAGCRFASRCAQADATCHGSRPGDFVAAHGGTARCHLLDPTREAA